MRTPSRKTPPRPRERSPVAASTRTGRRKRRESVRSALRTAALELARDAPFKDLTVEQIARAAGLTRSAFYFYFEDKHDLLLRATEEVAESLYHEADRLWHGEGAPDQRVRAALDGVLSVYAREGDLLRVVVEVSSYEREVANFWRTLIERFVRATADHLRAEQEAGRAAPLDADSTAEQLVWMVERCCYVYLASGERSPAELADSLTRTWIAALYPERLALLGERPAAA